MDISGQGIQLIKDFENCKLRAYQDIRGVWTCGYGATGPTIGPSTIWTQEQADSELLERIQVAANAVNSAVTVQLTQGQMDACCSLAYNIGGGAFSRSTLVKLVNKEDMVNAALEFTKWDKSNGQVVPGLLRRRQAEQRLFNGQNG